jgi:hypothetical protein
MYNVGTGRLLPESSMLCGAGVDRVAAVLLGDKVAIAVRPLGRVSNLKVEL